MTAIHATDVRIFDGDLVTYRLEEAGATLLALPGTGWSTRLRASSLEIVRVAIESYGWTAKRIRPPIPSAERITRMDEALGWITLIPIDRYVLRRIVGARSLVHPITERHLYPWRRLATAIGADHKAVQRWHAQGIDLIVAALNRKAAATALGVLVDRIDPEDRFGLLHRLDVQVHHDGLVVAAHQDAFQRLVGAGVDLLVRHIGRARR